MRDSFADEDLIAVELPADRFVDRVASHPAARKTGRAPLKIIPQLSPHLNLRKYHLVLAAGAAPPTPKPTYPFASPSWSWSNGVARFPRRPGSACCPGGLARTQVERTAN